MRRTYCNNVFRRVEKKKKTTQSVKPTRLEVSRVSLLLLHRGNVKSKVEVNQLHLIRTVYDNFVAYYSY